MPEQTIDLKKRRFLTQATSVVGAVGAGLLLGLFNLRGSRQQEQGLQAPQLM